MKFGRHANRQVVEIAGKADELVSSGKTHEAAVYIRMRSGTIDRTFLADMAEQKNFDIEQEFGCYPGDWRLAYTVNKEDNYITEPFRNGLPDDGGT